MAIGKNPCQRNCRVCSVLCDSQQQTTDNSRQWDYDIYRDFPIKINRSAHGETGPIFASHWHEQFQVLYFVQGEALIHCNSHSYEVQGGDMVIINSNEIHYGETLCKELVYDIVKVDLNFLLSSQNDFCHMKYITPLLQGRIAFQNHITHDEELPVLIQQIVQEYRQQEIGCELAIKAYIYQMVVVLLRHYQQEVTPQKLYEYQQKTTQQLRSVLTYVDQHYHENISLSQMANLSNMSKQHFCRVFKSITGKRPMDYINYLRINKAVSLLTQQDFNISEIAMKVGFDDSNYFSRLFKKYQKTTPSIMRKKMSS